jgi:hypothetical protein
MAMSPSARQPHPHDLAFERADLQRIHERDADAFFGRRLHQEVDGAGANRGRAEVGTAG